MHKEAVATKIKIDRITDRGRYKTVKSGDEFYNVWDAMVAERLKTGETVVAMVETKTSDDPTTGKPKTFNNIVGLSDPQFDQAAAQLDMIMPGVAELNELPPPPPGLAGRQPSVQVAAPSVDLVQVRSTVLSAASLLLAHGVITQKQMLKTTTEFEKYVLHGNLSAPSKTDIDVNDFVE